MKIFAGRVAFVTGGASGIGFGMVQNFLKLGMNVVIVDFNQGHLNEVAEILAGRDDVRFVSADVLT
jgi:NAD(P)-dependent dehydrogenase (short-subunit alcohol dehydrogenase family)